MKILNWVRFKIILFKIKHAVRLARRGISVTISYDEGLSDVVWDALSDSIKNKDCPSCGTVCTKDDFGGVFNYRGKPRFIHNTLPCLLLIEKGHHHA